MKTTGVTRRVDELGRVVIPKEFRRILRIRIGELVEINLNKSGELSLKKYSPFGELGNLAREYTESLCLITGMTSLVCNTEIFIASSSIGKSSLKGKKISDKLINIITDGSLYTSGQDEKEPLIPLTEDDDFTGYSNQLICPIVFLGNSVGAVILIGKKPTDIVEQKLIQTATDFFVRMMED